ncbi:type II secretion system protein [Candidatus Uhrbacteria bacterium]|nr:type II secretion system protein [Candidatus Uhrbacteria bacterium]
MWITWQTRKKRGFTLIELLVVIAIIGILTTVASLSLLGARRRARDTKRVSDMQQIRNALVVYSNQRATYPPATSTTTAEDIELGRAEARCLDDSDAGFSASCADADRLQIMQSVPFEQWNGSDYLYRKTAAQEYEIDFVLEGGVGDLPGGNCTATQSAITCAP